MKKYLALCLVLLTMTACSKLQAPAESNADVASKSQSAASRYLAYEHSIELDTDEEKVSEIFNKALAACHEASDALCTVLQLMGPQMIIFCFHLTARAPAACMKSTMMTMIGVRPRRNQSPARRPRRNQSPAQRPKRCHSQSRKAKAALAVARPLRHALTHTRPTTRAHPRDL